MGLVGVPCSGAGIGGERGARQGQGTTGYASLVCSCTWHGVGWVAGVQTIGPHGGRAAGRNSIMAVLSRHIGIRLGRCVAGCAGPLHSFGVAFKYLVRWKAASCAAEGKQGVKDNTNITFPFFPGGNWTFKDIFSRTHLVVATAVLSPVPSILSRETHNFFIEETVGLWP